MKMGRSLLVEEKIERDLGGLTAAQSVQIGLLVGQVTTQRDYVTFCIPTPSLKELRKEEEAVKKPVQSLFEDWWVVEHAKEVSALLPGGLSVIGVFLVCPTDLLKSLQPRLRKLLLDIASTYQSSTPSLPPPPHMDRAVLHTCLKTKKHKAQTVDLSDPQAGFRPAELKFQSHCSRWHRVNCSLALQLDTYIPTPPETIDAAPRKCLPTALQPTVHAISRSLVAVRGRVCQGEEPLVRTTGQRKTQAPSSGETVQAAMFLRKSPSPSSSSSPRTISRAARLRLNGSTRCLAYVHPKATCGEAAAAVREDAVRSLVNRVELCCREAEAELEASETADTESESQRSNGDSSHKVVNCADMFAICQLPRRVLVTIPTAELPLVGYSFPSETEEELRGNLGDLLSTTPEDIGIEQLEDFPAPPGPEDTDVVPSEAKASKGSLVPVVSLTVAVAMALTAVGVWFVQNMGVDF